jgi:hypothetical protein
MAVKENVLMELILLGNIKLDIYIGHTKGQYKLKKPIFCKYGGISF